MMKNARDKSEGEMMHREERWKMKAETKELLNGICKERKKEGIIERRREEGKGKCHMSKIKVKGKEDGN